MDPDHLADGERQALDVRITAVRSRRGDRGADEQDEAGEGDEGRRRPDVPVATRRLSWALVTLTGLVLLVGTAVTGTGPHGGYPDVERLPFAIREVVRLHGGLAWLVTALLLVLMVRTRRGGAVLAAVAAQISIGYIQYFNGVPEVLVGLHVLGATVVWITVLQLHLSLWVVEPTVASGAEPALAAP
jgi:cytochrome c oxidase assembly protein subunit 15